MNSKKKTKREYVRISSASRGIRIKYGPLRPMKSPTQKMVIRITWNQSPRSSLLDGINVVTPGNKASVTKKVTPTIAASRATFLRTTSGTAFIAAVGLLSEPSSACPSGFFLAFNPVFFIFFQYYASKI